MARRLFSRRLLRLHICSRANLRLYNPARCPDSLEPLRLLGPVPSYCPYVVVPYHLSHSPVLPITSPSSFPPRSRRSMSYELALSASAASLLPTSVFLMNSSTSTVVLSPNRALTFLRSGVSLITIFLVFSFHIIVARSLRHFLHSSKTCSTVCLLLLHH